MSEKVILVGAGPGDRALLTLRGAQAIQQADAVVYDRLVSPDILELIPARAQRIAVGKENNHHPVPQEQINQIPVDLAKSGKRTVQKNVNIYGHMALHLRWFQVSLRHLQSQLMRAFQSHIECMVLPCILLQVMRVQAHRLISIFQPLHN